MIDPVYLEAQRAALGPDDYDREFNAAFTSGSAAFIEPERVRECTQEWLEALPGDGREWVVSIDPSFSRDPAALAVIGRSRSHRDRLLVGHTRRWLPPKTRLKVRRTRTEDTSRIEHVVSEMAAVCSRYGVLSVITDQHLSGTMEGEFRKYGLRVRVRAWTTESKVAAFRSLRALIYTGRIELPHDPVLIAEAGRLRESNRGGTPKVETPRAGDSHCDLIVSVAAGVLELERHGQGRARTWSSFKHGRPHVFSERERRALDETLMARGVGVVRP